MVFEVDFYWLAQTGADQNSSEIPEWIRVFLGENQPAETLVSSAHASPQRRALALQRYRPRRPVQPLEHCLEQARHAPHPQLRMVWLLLLVHHHGRRAIPPLLSALARRDDFAQACCWALGRLGRDIVLEIGERFGGATAGVQELYCQALWYLGRQARGCEKWLGNTPWSRAVLYRLEDWGWRLLLQWRASPLWLNQESLAALAELAFSLEAEERRYALRALLGWGPARAEAARMLEVLAYDSNPELAEAALLALRQLGVRLSMAALREVLRRCPPEVGKVAVNCFFERIEPSEALDDPEVSQLVVRALGQHPFDPVEYLVLDCLAELEPDLQIQVLQLVEIPEWSRQKSLKLLVDFLMPSHPISVRSDALVAFARMGGERRVLAYLLDDGEAEIRLAAAELLVQREKPDFIIAHLDSPEILSQFYKLAGALRALVEWTAEDLEALQKRLSQLGGASAQAVLSQWKLGAVQWSRYNQFTSTQLAVARALIRHNQAFPAELLAMMTDGKVQNSTALALFAMFASAQELHDHLPELFEYHRMSERILAWEALQARGGTGWAAALDLVGAADERVAMDAVQQLAQWFPGHEWLDRVGARILEIPVHPLVRAAVADWIALVKVHPLAEIHPEGLTWALAILPYVSQFKPMVEGYLDKSQRSGADLSQLMDSYLQRAELRFDILRWLRLWRPEGVAARVRAWPSDPDPRLQLARLQLLFETDQLSAEEIEQLTGLGELPELAQEVALLRLSLDLRNP